MGGNQQVPQAAGNPRYNDPGLDPSPDPKIVVKAVNPPVTPDQVVAMAEMPSAATLDLPKIQNIKISPVKNKTIQGHLKAIEAKMTATEKLMKDVVKLQKLQIITEKELFERKRELYQNTFEEYLLDKTVDFENPDDPGGANSIKKGPGGFGFPFGGGRRRRKGRPPGSGSGAGAAATAGAATTAAERMADGQASGLPNLGTDYKQQEQDAIKKTEEFRRQQEQKTKVRPKGNPPLREGEQDAEPLTPVVEPDAVPKFVPDPITPPVRGADPADISTDIEALKYLYEQQPSFTGGLVGNMIPPNTMVHERADGYMVLVSPHARQDAEGPNPFVNGGKVRVLPPTVTVLRPEDVAALQSSDAAKAADALELYMAVQDVLAAMYGLKTRNGRTPKAGTVPYGRVSQPRMRDAINTIKRRRTNTTPVAPVEATVTPKQSITGALDQRAGSIRSTAASFRAESAAARTDFGKDMLTDSFNQRRLRRSFQQGNQSQGDQGGRKIRKVFQSNRQPGVSFETNMDVSDFVGGFGPRPLTLKEQLIQMRQPSFDQYDNPIGPQPKASGGVGDVDLYSSKSLNYFRGMSSKIMPMADGGFMGWFNKGVNTRIPNEAKAKFGNPFSYFQKNPDPTTLFGDDALQRGQSNKNFKAGKKPSLFGRPDRAFGLDLIDSVKQRRLVTVPASQGGPMSGPTPITREIIKRPIRASAHPLIMLAEMIVNELINPQPTAVYDQVTGPNAYYNAPGYKGPMPSQNLENAQSSMMSGNDPKVEVKPLPPDYIKIPGKKKAPDFVGTESPDIEMRSSVFTRSSTHID